jgi:hypothetical protein
MMRILTLFVVSAFGTGVSLDFNRHCRRRERRRDRWGADRRDRREHQHALPDGGVDPIFETTS